MSVRIEKTKIIKPIYFEGNNINLPLTSNYIPLSVFDKVTYNTHVAVIYAYSSPTPPNETIEIGLQRVLSEYREFAGRLGENENGEPVIFLNDKGVKLFEATIDIKLDQVMPLKPSSFLYSLHPSLKDIEELAQVQLTRFSCGSLVIGFTSHHFIADGFSASNFLCAWGKATRGLDIGPLPLHDRTIFTPRNPPNFEFEHRGVEFKSKKVVKDSSDDQNNSFVEGVEVYKVNFPKDFISSLKVKASPSSLNKPYSTFESLVAHLWKAITKARRLEGSEATRIQIAVNGRMRMSPKVLNEYFGNMVLWTFPSSRVEDLVREPLAHAAKLIHDAVAGMNDNYFKSFIDFAILKAEKNEELVPMPYANMPPVYCPNLKVDSWLGFPFCDVDFGGGSPCVFMPSYLPVEGFMFLLPSFTGDGSIDAFIPLFRNILDTFQQIVYTLD